MKDKLFQVRDVVRYADGPTALMVILSVYPGYGGAVARYYGRQFFGGTVGAYHEDLLACLRPRPRDGCAPTAAA